MLAWEKLKAEQAAQAHQGALVFDGRKGANVKVVAGLGLAVLMLFTLAFGQWTEPVLVDEPGDTVGINTPFGASMPFVTADGQRLFYAVGEHDGNAYDIYLAHRTDTGWGPPVRLPFCQRNREERNPSVNVTCDTLYFISYSGGWDIFWSFRTDTSDTAWSQPQRLPEPINSTGIEWTVFCTPDNQRLLFSSWRSGTDGQDIFECRRDVSTSSGWSDPIHLTGPLNTFDMEQYPSMGLDTTELFFHGRRDQICVSTLTDSGWSFGTPLPANINARLNEMMPCISADGRRLYFDRDNGHYTYLMYADRIVNSGPPRPLPVKVEPALFAHFDGAEVGLTLAGLAASGKYTATIFDLLGRTVQKGAVELSARGNALTGSLRVQGLPSGTYLIRLQSRQARWAARFEVVR